VNLAKLLGKCTVRSASGDDVRGELVFDERDAVAQEQLAFFEPLHLERVGADRVLQRADGGIEVPMLLLQAHERRAELAFFLFGHRRGAAGSVRQRTAPGRSGDALSQKKRSNQELPAPGPPLGPEIPLPSPLPVSRFGRPASSGVAVW